MLILNDLMVKYWRLPVNTNPAYMRHTETERQSTHDQWLKVSEDSGESVDRQHLLSKA